MQFEIEQGVERASRCSDGHAICCPCVEASSRRGMTDFNVGQRETGRPRRLTGNGLPSTAVVGQRKHHISTALSALQCGPTVWKHPNLGVGGNGCEALPRCSEHLIEWEEATPI